MLTFARLLGYVGYAALAALMAGVVAAGLRRWSVAVVISRTVSVCGLGVIALVVSVFLLILVSPQVASSFLSFSVDADPSQKARVLAQAISETMNCAAFASLAALPSLLLWIVARRRLRSAQGDAGGRVQ